MTSDDEFLPNCLGVECPELCKDWHPTKNLPLTITNTAYGSKKKIWWKCHLCAHEWQAYIKNRRRNFRRKDFKGTSCPNCLGKEVKDEI